MGDGPANRPAPFALLVPRRPDGAPTDGLTIRLRVEGLASLAADLRSRPVGGDGREATDGRQPDGGRQPEHRRQPDGGRQPEHRPQDPDRQDSAEVPAARWTEIDRRAGWNDDADCAEDSEYRDAPYLLHGAQLHVPNGIASLAGYGFHPRRQYGACRREYLSYLRGDLSPSEGFATNCRNM